MDWRRATDLTIPGDAIAGFRLYPPTVGHAVLLLDLGIDLFSVSSVPDMLMACFILAHKDHDEAERDVARWWSAAFLRFYAWLFVRRFNTSDEAEKFGAFLRANNESPEVVMKENKRRPMGSPWQWRLYAALMSECGMSKADALSTPIQDAQLLTTATGEMRGNVELWSDADEAFWRACEEADKAKGLG